MNIKEEAAKMKLASPLMASASAEKRNSALLHMIENLEAEKEKIFAANRIDLAAAKASGLAPAVMKRLAFDEGKLADSISGIRQLISLPDPVGKVTLARQLDEGLRLYRVTCPIGVIAMIFEARPDAMIQISSLAVKSGNCAILKGGKETKETNRVLFSLLHEAATDADLPSEALFQAEQHSEIDELLACRESVDLIIPRGSNAFVQHIMSRTSIPVMTWQKPSPSSLTRRPSTPPRAMPQKHFSSTGISPKTFCPYWKKPPEKNTFVSAAQKKQEKLSP